MTPIAFIENYIPFRALLVKILIESPYNYTVYEYDNGMDFITKFPTENYTPAIVLMDIGMPLMNGYETTAWLKKHHPTFPVLVFSDIENPRSILDIIRCGANGYAKKTSCYEPAFLHKIIQHMLDGHEYYGDRELCAFIKKQLLKPQTKIKEGLLSLSKREMEVIRHLDLDNKIHVKAEQLNIAPSTYNKRTNSIFKKLGLSTTKAL